MGVEVGDFSPWLARWAITPDGAPFVGPEAGSWLLPVRKDGLAAMLKLGRTEDERRGSAVMAWWDGGGAAPVLAHDERALLMLRALGPRSLVEIAEVDEEAATRTICAVVDELHRPRSSPPPQLPPLERLFAGLRAAAANDARFASPAAVAAELLASQHDFVVLHGDVHHRNILDFETAGWLAIDPWGYVGERTYEYANLLKNPTYKLMTATGRFRRQVEVISDTARIDAARLLRWGYAHCALAAAWAIEDGRNPANWLEMMQIACGELAL
jgi:streptomycin 6-kinase